MNLEQFTGDQKKESNFDNKWSSGMKILRI